MAGTGTGTGAGTRAGTGTRLNVGEGAIHEQVQVQDTGSSTISSPLVNSPATASPRKIRSALLSLGNSNLTTIKLRVVQSSHSILSVVLAQETDKGKTTGFARSKAAGDVHIADLTIRTKLILERFISAKSNIQIRFSWYRYTAN